MFEALSDRFETIFSSIRGKGKLREEDVDPRRVMLAHCGDTTDLDYLEKWTNWREYMADRQPGTEATFPAFVAALKAQDRAVANYKQKGSPASMSATKAPADGKMKK